MAAWRILFKKRIIPYFILGILFFVTGFGVGISGFLTPFFESALKLSTPQSYLVTTAIFSAFLLFGLPAGWLLEQIGYHKSMVLAFFIMSIGMALFIPSAKLQSFPLFLFALFIGGIGNTILQASINPFVTNFGDSESAAQRMCVMGILNKSAWWLGPFFLGLFLNLKDIKLQAIVTPFLLITVVLLVMGLFLMVVVLPEVKSKGVINASPVANGQKRSIWSYPHLLLGTLALFIYVGIETMTMVSVIGYTKAIFGASITSPENYLMFVIVGLALGYLTGMVCIPKYLSQRSALLLFATIGFVASLVLVFAQGMVGFYALAFLGFANSLMWPSIWPLSLADLGHLTKKGSAIMVMGLVGGAIVPLLFAMILNWSKRGDVLTLCDYQNGYWLLVPAYLFILFFGAKGSKMRR